ncbi:SGNH/GDSL hydrolase family protein [Mucilaginibacter sp. CSA2-8R]|uniref:SGNH/GDSL hydrolase family protein n=1 Tax=Mucilaginibacter sp. CSA2-8R TaxID=3141542 RepID=UPI00315D699C
MKPFQILLIAASTQQTNPAPVKQKAVITIQPFDPPRVGDEPLLLNISSTNTEAPVVATVAPGSEGKLELSLVNGIYQLTGVAEISSAGLILSQAETDHFLAADDAAVNFAVLPEIVTPVGNVSLGSDGNSLNFGQGSSDPATKSPIGVLKTRLPSNYTGFFNAAVSGQSVEQMIARFNDFVLIHYKSDADQNVLFMGDPVNDIIGNGTSVQDTYNNLKQYFTTAKDAGFKTVVLTMTACMKPYGIGVIAGENQRQECNRIMRQVWKSEFGCNALVDLGRHPILGVYDPAFNQNYFSGDGQHLNDAGYVLKTDEIQLAIEAVVKGKYYGTEEQQHKAPAFALVAGVNKITVNIGAVAGATNYVIMRNTRNSINDAVEVHSGPELSFDDTTMIPGNPYWYFVKAQGAGKTDSPYYINNGIRSQEANGGVTPSVGKVAHYMADQGVAVTGSSFTWADQSGNNKHLFNMGNALPVKLAADLNGLPTIKFNNSPLCTTVPIGIKANSPRTYMMVICKGMEGQNIMSIGTGGSLTGDQTGLFADLAFYNNQALYNVYDKSANIDNVPYSFIILTLLADGNGNVDFYMNDTKVSGNYPSTNMLSGSPLTVGKGRLGLGDLNNAKIAEIIIRDDNSEQERSSNYAYLKNKYGL